MTGRDKTHFVFLAALGWDSVIAGRTRRLAEAVAQMGFSCTFVELPSLRRSLARTIRPVKTDGVVQVESLLPDPLKLRLWRRYAARKLRNLVSDQRSVVVATTPLWAPLVENLDADVLCYDCNDCLSVHCAGRNVGQMKAMHDRLISACDVVTTVSQPLVQQLRSAAAQTPVHLIPNGVDEQWIDAKPIAIDRSSIAGRDAKIVGFVGSLYEWIDFDLLAACARALPNIDFVVAGPQRRGVDSSAIDSLDNIYRHGALAFEDVPAWIAAFDAAIVPFKRDEINISADPLKIYEYCALGKSVVSTCAPGAGCEDAPIYLAATSEEFIEAISRAIEEDSPELQERRRQFARANTWRRRGEEFIDALSRSDGEQR